MQLVDIVDAIQRNDDHVALKLAAKFKLREPLRSRIQRGAQAITSPAFYKSIGLNCESLIDDGIAATKELVKQYGY